MALVQLKPFRPHVPIRRRVVVPRADANEVIILTGKFIGSFVLFTSSMNWWYYKRTREDAEKNKK